MLVNIPFPSDYHINAAVTITGKNIEKESFNL